MKDLLPNSNWAYPAFRGSWRIAREPCMKMWCQWENHQIQFIWEFPSIIAMCEFLGTIHDAKDILKCSLSPAFFSNHGAPIRGRIGGRRFSWSSCVTGCPNQMPWLPPRNKSQQQFRRTAVDPMLDANLSEMGGIFGWRDDISGTRSKRETTHFFFKSHGSVSLMSPSGNLI